MIGVDGRRRSELVYDALRERLLAGRWAAGEPILIEEVKVEFGVSKQPVMDAVRRLSAAGLLEVIPQVGCRVPSYPPNEAEDFFRLFAAAESEVTSIAAARASDLQLDRLAATNGRIGAALEGSPEHRTEVYMTLNREFHSTIQEMCQSPILGRTSSQMWDMCDLLIMTAGRGNPIAHEVRERYEEHERIIDALRDRDGATARNEMHAHIIRNVPMLTS
jgi:DNA-binding GntR family transcriptional regulator